MGLFDNFGSKIRNALGVRRISSLTNVFPIGSPEVYTTINSGNVIDQGYNGNTAVYSILNKDAQKFASIPTFVYKKGSDDDEQEVLENDLSKLLLQPNEYEGQDAFRAKLRTYYKLTGEVFVWLNRGDLGDDIDEKARLKRPVLEMYILPSEQVLLIPDPDNLWGVLGYKLEANGQRLTIPKSDVIHWKNTTLKFDASTRDHLRGFSPLTAGYKTLQQNNDATASAVRMYQNDGAKGVLYNETLDKGTPEQKQTIKDVVDRKINRNDVKGSVATLQGKWGYLDLGKTNTDLALLEGKNISLRELCFLFDVPYELFDPQTTFANKEQAQKGWLYNSIMPSCKQWDDECNRVLLQAFNLENTAEIRSDFDDLPEMREDVSQLVASLQNAWWITPNEKRDWMGFEPLPDEHFNEPMIPGGIEPLSMIGQGMEEVERTLRNQGLDD